MMMPMTLAVIMANPWANVLWHPLAAATTTTGRAAIDCALTHYDPPTITAQALFSQIQIYILYKWIGSARNCL